MFVGHYATGLIAKRFAPETSLGLLFLAAVLLDLLWPIFLLLGLEQVHIDPGNTAVTPLDFQHYPWSHSFVMAIVWAVVLAGAVRGMGFKLRSSLFVGLCVVSHWILDVVVHRPDLPLWPDGPVWGLGVWNSKPGTVALEFLSLAIGVFVYTHSTRAHDNRGRYGFAFLIALLVVVYASNVLGPLPPNEMAIAVVGNAQWVFVLLGVWIDRHRTPMAMT